MEQVLQSMAIEMHRIIALQKNGKASKKELIDLAILTKALENLTFNDK